MGKGPEVLIEYLKAHPEEAKTFEQLHYLLLENTSKGHNKYYHIFRLKTSNKAIGHFGAKGSVGSWVVSSIGGPSPWDTLAQQKHYKGYKTVASGWADCYEALKSNNLKKAITPDQAKALTIYGLMPLREALVKTDWTIPANTIKKESKPILLVKNTKVVAVQKEQPPKEKLTDLEYITTLID